MSNSTISSVFFTALLHCSVELQNVFVGSRLSATCCYSETVYNILRSADTFVLLDRY